jgi:hypothetical protein
MDMFEMNTFKAIRPGAEKWMDSFDIAELLEILNRRRQKIIQRGRLTNAENNELYCIDEEIERFEKL